MNEPNESGFDSIKHNLSVKTIVGDAAKKAFSETTDEHIALFHATVLLGDKDALIDAALENLHEQKDADNITALKTYMVDVLHWYLNEQRKTQMPNLPDSEIQAIVEKFRTRLNAAMPQD